VPRSTAPDPESFLPLKAPVFEVLLTLADGERHGYAILNEIADRSAGRISMFPAQLYRYLEKLLGDGLIAESDERPAPELDDERRRYYRITPLGLQVARAEARRLETVLAEARARLKPRTAR
jgi:DNA-binding PadR family transcriptional regulator